MQRIVKIILLLAVFVSMCMFFSGCAKKQEDTAQALEIKKIAESFIESYNVGDADACIGMLSTDIVVEQKAVTDTKSQDQRSVHEALKNNIALKHMLKIVKVVSNTDHSVTFLIEESGSEMKLIGVDSITYEQSFEVKDAKISRIVTVIDKKLAERLASKTAGGIGIALDIKADRILISSISIGSPADDAGLKAGDEIMAIDGVNCSEMKQGEHVLRIRGAIGSKVVLTLRHSDSNEILNVEVIRADLSKLQKN